ncbi:hypothetical protein TTHERM_00713260 (macronuclear) [Tetrahymena thermophila SB210]|uniref:Uncharacterized protein n=1 Tax=Tetrahymena thermophila (strain SB210) TaxID=312017 RepID=Q24CX5_TETTS|nr:hypothetical protein TTHERM_00713260 [Tetrahymena thermophila SB210]EAS05633.2 hypothetical protein TTHERM_00713260 [Tetrahymena thermophila SB210]|eukprot:XP_001025878.2 hypothetical protein TTHERM_00713260 [Tetrahymena thermophila SB210]
MTSKIVEDFIDQDPFLKEIFSFQKEKGYIKKRSSKPIIQDISILDEQGDEKLARIKLEQKEQKQESGYDQFDKLEDVPKIKDLKQSNPFKIDFLKEIQKLVEQNVIIKISIRSLQEKLQMSLISVENEQLSRYIFYYLVSFQIPQIFELSPETLQEFTDAKVYIKQKMAKKYLKTFTRLPKPKDQLIHYLLFTDIYLANMLCFKIFKSEKEKFNICFLFNSIHLIVYETTGMFVSESYIHTSIDRLFTSKFMEYEREEYVRIQKLINQQNKIKDEQFLGFQLPKLQENTIIDSNFQDYLSKMLNRKKQTRKRCVSQTSFSKSRIMRDDSISQAPSSNHQSFSITQPLLQSRSEKRSISHQRMSKTLKEDENSLTNQNKVDMPELIDSIKESQSTDRKFSRRNFNCASIGPAMSNALNKKERVLVGISQNVLQHRINVTDIGRGNLYQLLEDLKKERQQRKDYKQQDVQQRKIDLFQQYGLDYQDKIALSREHYINKNDELQKKFLENMIEMNYVLRKKREKANTLPSSEYTIQNLKRLKFEYMQEEIPNFDLKKINIGGDYQNQTIQLINNTTDQPADINDLQQQKSEIHQRSISLQNLKRQQSEQGSSFLDSTYSMIRMPKMINLNQILEEDSESTKNAPTNQVQNQQNNASILKKNAGIIKQGDQINQNDKKFSPQKTINFSKNLTQSNLNHQMSKSYYQRQSDNMKSNRNYQEAQQDNTKRKNSTILRTEPSPNTKRMNTQTTFSPSMEKNLSFSQKLNNLNKKLNLNGNSDKDSSESPRKVNDFNDEIYSQTNRKINTVIITKDTGPSEEEIYDKYHNRIGGGKNVYDQMILDQQKKNVLYKSNKSKLEQMQQDMIFKQEDKDKEYEILQNRYQKTIKTAYKSKEVAKKMKLISHQADKMIERLNFK